MRIDFVDGIAKWKKIYQLLKEFKQEGLNLSIEAIEQEPQEYLDYFQDEETETKIDEIDKNRKNTLVFSGDRKSLSHLDTLVKSGMLSEILGVKVCNLSIMPVNLNNWFQGLFEAGFQSLSDLINGERQLAYNLCSLPSDDISSDPVSGGKIIDLGIALNNKKIALIVKLAPDEDDKRNIQVQLFPSGSDQYLPPNIKLVMLTAAGKVLQEVESRRLDNYIQLLPFKNKIGKSFTLQVRLDEEMLSEDIFVI